VVSLLPWLHCEGSAAHQQHVGAGKQLNVGFDGAVLQQSGVSVVHVQLDVCAICEMLCQNDGPRWQGVVVSESPGNRRLVSSAAVQLHAHQ